MLPKNSHNSFFLKNKNNQNCPNSHKIFWLLFKKTFGQELLKTVQSGHAEVCCCNCEERDNPWCLLSSITITSYKTSGRAEWQFKSAQQRRRRRRRRWNGVINRHDGRQVGQTTLPLWFWTYIYHLDGLTISPMVVLPYCHIDHPSLVYF